MQHFRLSSLRFLCLAFVLGLVGSLLTVVGNMDATSSATVAPRTYMQIYSEAGTFSRVQISLVNPNGNEYRCGSVLSAGNGYTTTKKLPKTRALKMKCDAVGGFDNGMYYRVAFQKGKSGSYSRVHSTVDVDEGKCTIVRPASGAQIVNLTAGKNCPVGSDTITQHNVAASVVVTADNPNSVNPRRTPPGHIVLQEVGAWDGSNYVSKYFCTGSVSVTYTKLSDSSVQGPFTKKLRYTGPTSTVPNGHCRAKLGKDTARFNANTTYQITATYPGNAYLNAPGAATANFKTKP